MPVTVTTKDLGWKSISKQMRSKGVSLSVGIHGTAGEDLVFIGTVHEFGAPGAGIPERSFLRSTFDNKREELLQDAEAAVAETLEGGELAKAVGRVGLKMSAAVQATIRSNIPPALKPATIARKGSSVALIDTGRLIQSITSVVGVPE